MLKELDDKWLPLLECIVGVIMTGIISLSMSAKGAHYAALFLNYPDELI